MLAKYDALNVPALRRLIGSGAKLGYWSRPIMQAMRATTAPPSSS